MQVVRDPQDRQFAVCVPSLGTWGAGTICQQSTDVGDYQGILTTIPAGPGCSPDGRLRDAVALGDWHFLVSYAKVANGCMNIADDDQGRAPDFGIALVDVPNSQMLPVYNDPQFDEVQVQPVRPRALLGPGVLLPARPDLGCDRRSVRFEGFVDQQQLADGAVGIRLLQARSGGEVPWAVELGGVSPGAICTSAHGQVVSAPVQADGSFSADAPTDVALRLQVVDRYGAALASDPFWHGGPACAQRRCAACHSNQGQAPDFEGSLASLAGPADLAGGANVQLDYDFDRDIQPILTRSCAVSGCHDATSVAGNYVDLTGSLRGLDLHAEPAGRTSVAYRNLLFVDQLRASNTGQIIDQLRPWVVPGQARASRLIQKLGVPCRTDCAAAPAWAPWGMPAGTRHPEDQAAFAGELTDADRWRLVEWIDAGAVFHGRGATP
jgi:mono/diheme cytochrome c family protein